MIIGGTADDNDDAAAAAEDEDEDLSRFAEATVRRVKHVLQTLLFTWAGDEIRLLKNA